MPRSTFTLLSVVVSAVVIGASGCVQVQPPTDTGDPVVATSPTSPTPTSPTTPTPTTPAPTTPTTPTTPTSDPNALAYDPDMTPLFASDCVSCHNNSRADGNYRMSTYAQVMTAVRAGSASSKLVTITQSSGKMYRYFSGSTATRQAKANQVRTWVVTYNAQEKK